MSRDYRAGAICGIVAGILIAFFVIIPSLAFFARALGQDYVVLNGLAKHLDGQIHCNSTTSGLGIEKNDYALGFYRNSNCKWSVYAAKAWLPVSLQSADWRIRAGLMSGVVTGYGRPLTPAGAFALALERGRYGVNLIYVPEVSKSGNVLWAQAKFRW